MIDNNLLCSDPLTHTVELFVTLPPCVILDARTCALDFFVGDYGSWLRIERYGGQCPFKLVEVIYGTFHTLEITTRPDLTGCY